MENVLLAAKPQPASSSGDQAGCGRRINGRGMSVEDRLTKITLTGSFTGRHMLLEEGGRTDAADFEWMSSRPLSSESHKPFLPLVDRERGKTTGALHQILREGEAVA
jgi:hypothetical protein